MPTGHLVYGAGNTLRAVGFDVRGRSVRGTPVPVLSPILMTGQGGVVADMANDGTLVYVAGGALTVDQKRELVWVDRKGREEPLGTPLRPYQYPRLSPDGKRVVVNSGYQERDLWIWDLARATLTRGTLDPALDNIPLWTPDGQRIIFNSNHEELASAAVHDP